MPGCAAGESLVRKSRTATPPPRKVVAAVKSKEPQKTVLRRTIIKFHGFAKWVHSIGYTGAIFLAFALRLFLSVFWKDKFDCYMLAMSWTSPSTWPWFLSALSVMSSAIKGIIDKECFDSGREVLTFLLVRFRQRPWLAFPLFAVVVVVCLLWWSFVCCGLYVIVQGDQLAEQIFGRNELHCPSETEVEMMSTRALLFLSVLLQLVTSGARKRIRLETKPLGSRFGAAQQMTSSYFKLGSNLTWCSFITTACLTAAIGALLVRSTNLRILGACFCAYEAAVELVELLGKLPMKTWKVGRMDCPVCLDEQLGCNDIFVLGCGHVVCRECSKDLRLDAAAGNPCCPHCRQAVGGVFTLS